MSLANIREKRKREDFFPFLFAFYDRVDIFSLLFDTYFHKGKLRVYHGKPQKRSF